MTAKEMIVNIGRNGMLSTPDFDIRVTVMDARLTYGRVQYRVAGIDGNEGQAWVDAGRVTVEA